jgi:hypothetical protein
MLNEHCLFRSFLFPSISVFLPPAYSLYGVSLRQPDAAFTPLVEGRSLPDSSYLRLEADGIKRNSPCWQNSSIDLSEDPRRAARCLNAFNELPPSVANYIVRLARDDLHHFHPYYLHCDVSCIYKSLLTNYTAQSS